METNSAPAAPPAAAPADEIKQIEGWMGAPKGSADSKKYWDDPAVSGPGGRYQTLLSAKSGEGEASPPARQENSSSSSNSEAPARQMTDEAFERVWSRASTPSKGDAPEHHGYDFGGRVIQSPEANFFHFLGTSMKAAQVEPVAVNAFVKWLDSAPDRILEVERAHPYDWRGTSLDGPNDLPVLDHFGNAMAAANARAEDVYATVRWYSDSIAAARKREALEARARAVRDVEASRQRRKGGAQ